MPHYQSVKVIKNNNNKNDNSILGDFSLNDTSLNFKQILAKKISNDRKCSITSYNEENFMIFMKNQKYCMKHLYLIVS